MVTGSKIWLLTISFLVCFYEGICGKIHDEPKSANDYLSDDYDYNEDYDIYKSNSTELFTINNIDPTLDPPYFENNELKMHVKPGDNVLINCDVRNFQIKNVIIWYKENTVITNGQFIINNRIEGMKNNSIQIKDVQPEDAGNYYCEVLPQKKRLHVELTVGGRLAILCDGRDVTDRSILLREGENHTFDCKTYVSHPINVKWSFNGQRAENVVTEVDGNKMYINGISAEHAGIYQCLGDDGSQEPSHGMVTVDVQYGPKLSTHRHFVNTQSGSKAELYCDYRANPLAISKWLKDGHAIGYSEKYMIKNMVLKGHNRTILTVTDINADDLGEYICNVENSIGSKELKVHLIYEPEIPQFEEIKIDKNTVRMQWLVRSVQPLSEAVLDYKIEGSYTWSTVSVIHTQRHRDNTDMWKITHEMELIPGDWHARVKTKNTVGWSKFSAQHDFKIKKENNEMKEDDTLPPDDIVKAAGIGLGNKGNVRIQTNENVIAMVLISLIFVWKQIISTY